MRRVRVQEERKPVRRPRWWELEERILPLDPRDQDIVRAKGLQRRSR